MRPRTGADAHPAVRRDAHRDTGPLSCVRPFRGMPARSAEGTGS